MPDLGAPLEQQKLEPSGREAWLPPRLGAIDWRRREKGGGGGGR